ncbi:MAG TPA: PaaI family thioesterase [Pseudonocardia sp.]|nr:PaaI family thioesterase [Pseudonocardia sp.]
MSSEFGTGVRMTPHDRAERSADSPALPRRRAAVAELGAQVRALVDAVVGTEVETDELERCAAQVGALTEALGARRREHNAPAAVDDLLGGVRMYNPVSGAGSPLSPPLEVELGAGTATGRTALGLPFEGPPTYVHGGVSALLADQILGAAVAASGNPGMTTELSLRYRRPVPLLTPLLVSGETVDVSGRWVRATGVIAAADQPDRTLVEAEATFVCLNPEQARRLFPG